MTFPAYPDQAAHGPTGDAVSGRATGALFFLGFGAVWAFLGLRELHRATPSSLDMLAVTTLALLACALWLLRRARSLPPGFTSPEAEARMSRMFTAVNIIQWVSVFIAIAILNVLHHPAYIAPAIVIIVGLHLFPLAQSFKYRQHQVTGALLVLWAAYCMVRLPLDRMSGICSVGTGIILLSSAASTLLRCLTSVRGVPSALPAEVSAA